MTTDSVPVPTGAVLVGVDGSQLSDAALGWAASKAQRSGSPLHVVHAFAYIHTMGGIAVFDPGDPTELGGAVCADAARKARAAYPDLRVTTEVRVGPAAPQLIKASREAGVVVLGARGHSRIGGLLVGSVSQQVAMHATCPVVVVRGDAHSDGPVVVGMDGSAEATEALRFALRHAADLGAAVRVVRAEYVEAPKGIPPGEWYSAVVDQVRELTATVRSSVDEAAHDFPGVDIELRVRQQHPVDALIEQSVGARLLVVARRGLGGFTGLLLGSVSQGVLSRADVPVAILPGPAEPRDEPEARDITR